MSFKPAPSNPPDAGRTTEELLSELQALRARNAALEESEQRYREAVESANSIIIRWDMEGNLTFFNEFAEKLFGFSEDEVLGRNVVGTIVPPSESTGRDLAAMIDDVLAHPERYELNINENICKNGERVTIAWTNRAIRDEHGNAVEILSVGNDITERRRAEESLQFERLQLLSIFDSIDEVIYISDPCTYEILYANKAMQDKFGKSLIGGICYREIQDRDAPCDFCTNGIILNNKDEPCRWEFHNPTVNRDFGIVDRIIKWPDGRDVRFEIALDITERNQASESLRESEEDLRAAFEQAAVGMTHVSSDGRFLKVNQKFCDITGYTREELLKMSAQDITHPTDMDEEARLIESLLSGRLSTFSSEKRYIRKDGAVVWVNLTVTPIFHNGALAYLMGITEDITGRKQAEAALQEAKAQAELYVDLMGHDINNIHQAALGYLELARDMPGDREEHLDMAIEALMRSTRLISNVRKLQKIPNAGHAHEVDLCEVLGEVYGEYARSPGKTVMLSLNGREHCHVLADDLLRDVFSNLVGNAVKHTGKRASVLISLDEAQEGGKAHYRVSVEDDGPGIRDELKKTLFSRSLKGSPRAKGMGLGLYIVKTLVGNYGGIIRVEDRVRGDHAKGARFVILLPMIK
ncbi:putative histidine kinase [Methanocella paludicola SANAE]|uniref:histidine kinase n=1 Tax=Methanocella paludicola (strain DSM 17711 / JCM 13418 / NBRC 101707 / SANAE) TaxID=304371 RepID=D1YUI4_METPS|nr:PAS domain S-box protein [Methanocella paludicola]BAI60106.1 putative histidine kinase [Methanocella paludicola SANAE]